MMSSGCDDKGSKSKNYCSVPQCSSRKTSSISFHIFPKDKGLLKVWKCKLKIGKEISKYMCVCSLHFKSEDYILPGIPTLKRRLKRGAVPSLHLPVSSHDSKRRTSTEDTLKRAARANARHKLASTPLKNISQEIIPQEDCDCLSPNILNPSNNEEKSVQTDISNLFQKDQSVQVNVLNPPLPITVLNILRTNEDLYKFTGISSIELFQALVKCVDQKISKKTSLPVEGTVLIVLMKMKLVLQFNVLAVMFNIPETSCRRYFHETVICLGEVLRNVIWWPDKDEILRNIPSCFKHFNQVRVVLDCTEIQVEQPKCLRCRILTYSHYKGGHTVKFLIGVSPAGLITFVGSAFGGRASDKFITNQSKVLEKLEPYVDAVMVDKGFAIDDECCQLGINLIRPPFLKAAKQLSCYDAKRNANIAKARVHVERAIGRLKQFAILSTKLEWQQVPYIDAMMTIAAGVVNLSSPILSEVRFK